MTTLTPEAVIAAFRQAVQDRGEGYIYPQDKSDPNWWLGGACRYSTLTGQPACIVGQALYNIDPGLVPDTNRVAPADDVINDIVRRHLGISSYSSEYYSDGWNIIDSALTSAQEVQDKGGTWGEASDAFERSLSRDGSPFG